MPASRHKPDSAHPPSNPLAEAHSKQIAQIEQIASGLDSIQSHLDQASDLAETGALASMYAHEVNNLMTQVSGRAQLALMHLDQPERVIHALELARHASTQIAQLSEIFMGDAQSTPHQSSSASIADIHRRALGFLAEQDIAEFECSITGSIASEPDIPAAMLQQVLLNLYLNAIRALKETDTPRRRRLSTLIETIETDPYHHCRAGGADCSTWNNSQTIRITVEDTGVGMDPDQLAGLMGTKERGSADGSTNQDRGHGLGLTICSRLISNAQGSIVADSTLGAGTKMIITLPASAKPGSPKIRRGNSAA